MFGLTTTRRLHAELAAAKAETDRQRKRADQAEERATTAEFNRSQILTQLATADGRNKELQHRLTEAVACSAAEKFTHADDELDEAHARADRLQKRLDDATGLNTSRGDVGITDSAHWKPPVPLNDQPTPGRNPR